LFENISSNVKFARMWSDGPPSQLKNQYKVPIISSLKDYYKFRVLESIFVSCG